MYPGDIQAATLSSHTPHRTHWLGQYSGGTGYGRGRNRGCRHVLGTGTANAAPDVVNRSFNDAERLIQQAGRTAVIATRTGAGLEDGKCLVMTAWDAGYQRMVRGGMRANNEVLLVLNCNGVLAGPGSSGNSMESPVGREAKLKAERAVAKLAAHPRQAEAAASHG